MTRDIKFRAWNNSTKYWLDMYFFFKFINGTLEYTEVDNVVIEQYTGINDVNGVEIYENDIVIATPVVPGDEQYTNSVPMGVVKYDEGAYFIFGSNNAIRLFQETIQISVVGNVHQNLELLEGS